MDLVMDPGPSKQPVPPEERKASSIAGPSSPSTERPRARSSSPPSRSHPSALISTSITPSSSANKPSAASGRTSRPPSRTPSPIRSIAQAPYSSRASPTAAANINATASATVSLTSSERQQLTDNLKSSHTKSRTLHETTPSAPTEMIQTVSSTAAGLGPETMPAPPQPSYRRSQSYRFARPQSAAPPLDRTSEPQQPSTRVRGSSQSFPQRSYEDQEKERQRLKAAAAAKLAEQEAWEKTRGAGSSVLDLLKSSSESGDNSADSGGERLPRATTPGSGHGSAVSTPSSGNESNSSSSNSGQSSGRRPRQMRKHPSAQWDACHVLPTLEDAQSRRYEPVIVSSADKLLSRGISEYTLLPKVLGRGKFSSVFLASKPHGPNGDPQLFAIKHTPLFPHHPLIATRLLREPTLLAELPPHPNLVNVYETIRTPGHFYLVEEYLGDYVTLEALLPMRSEQSPPNLPILPTGVANCILDQLLSAVHAIHHPLQICHRDIKPENILVHPDTLQLKLLDFGLATHFSRSEAKLSTCCGSPAFHCPEIVTALRNPLGTVRYWGPEVDAWTCGITMLRLLTGVRYPIGASHSSVRSMSIRAQRAVSTIQDPELRDRVGKLLEINGERRMKNFVELVQALEQDQGEPQRGQKEFKSTTFIPAPPQHKMNLPLVVGPAAEAALTSPLLPSGATPSASLRSTPMSSRATSPAPGASAAPVSDFSEADLSPAPSLLLSNPSIQPPQRVLSYIKYCLRCAGILYHCWPDTNSSSSLPPTPGPFETAFQEYNTSTHSLGHVANGSKGPDRLQPTTSSVEAAGAGAPEPDNTFAACSSPTTPFPLQAARSERDPYSHIHIFECVLEIVDEPEMANEQQPSLVQTIFSALTFGRRPTNRRSMSTPPKPELGSDQPKGMPRPPGTPADAPISGSAGASGKEGDVKCLVFYLVVRFPRRPVGRVSFVASRPAYSRSTSMVGRSQRSRSRASSSVAVDRETGELYRNVSTDSLTRLSKLNSANAEFVTGIHPLRKAMIDSNHTTPRASRTASPSVAYNSLKKREDSLASRRGRREATRSPENSKKEDHLGLTIETSPELLRIAEAQASGHDVRSSSSAPASRATSRARSRKSSRARASSNTHHPGGTNKVFIHVSDLRALDALRKALSIGGTTTDYNPDTEMDLEENGWASPSLKANDFGPGYESETGSGATLQVGSKLRRPTSRRRPQSFAGSPVNSELDRWEGVDKKEAAFRPTWTDTPKGSVKARSTISHGSDDTEQYSRGRSLGPAGTLVAASGIPVPPSLHRIRAPSNLSFAVVQEESSPSNTDPSVSQSKTMLDLREESLVTKANFCQVPDQAKDASTLDLSKALSSILSRVQQTSQSGTPEPTFLNDMQTSVSEVSSHLLQLQVSNKAQMVEELDALSFDLVQALSPLLGLVSLDGAESMISKSAREVLELLADNASGREIYMAINMRCGEVLREKPWQDLQIDSVAWIKVGETIQLMRLLNMVLPRIRTKKPNSFSSVFALLPQCLSPGLESAARVSVPLSEALARQAIEACCSTALNVVDWEFKCIGTTEREAPKKTSREALGRFLQGVTICLPHLAGAETALSEQEFFANSPRYAITRPSDDKASAPRSIIKENEAIFAEISKTLASLEVDLPSVWSASLQSMSHAPEDDEVRETLSALGVGGFVVHTHLLLSGYARDKPSEWRGVRAQTQLTAALPIILLALTSQTKAASSPELQEGREDALADTSLLWMMWTMRGLGETHHLPAELTTTLAQTLATQSVISPCANARLIRFKLLTDLLTSKSDKKLALEILGELSSSSPFAQMQAGAISILRIMVAAPTKEADSSVWTEAATMLVSLLDKLFVLPESLIDASSDVGTVAEVLAREADKYTESLSLLYSLQTQKRIAASQRTKYHEGFLQPLTSQLNRLQQTQTPLEAEVSRKVQLLTIAAERCSL